MPLNCDCYPGCWGDHVLERNWFSYTGTKRVCDSLYRISVSILPRGTYVVRVASRIEGNTAVPVNMIFFENHDLFEKVWQYYANAQEVVLPGDLYKAQRSKIEKDLAEVENQLSTLQCQRDHYYALISQLNRKIMQAEISQSVREDKNDSK